MSAYSSFGPAIYLTAGCVQGATAESLEEDFGYLSRHLKVSKVYIETHRGTTVPEAKVREVKGLFEAKGVCQ